MDLSLGTKICSMTSIWSFRDVLEILLFSGILYYFSRWLALHVTRKLVIMMYSYCLLIIVAYALSLPLIFNFLVVGAPVACMLLMLMHQNLLQKNFVVPQKIVPARRDQSWIEALVQSCMIASAQNKTVTIVIQHHDDIRAYIHNGCLIESPCHKELLLMLLQSATYNSESFVYIDSDGMIVSLNSVFKNVGDRPSCDSPLSATQESALVLSAKTDALIVHCDHGTCIFNVILRGSITSKLTAQSCTRLIDDYVHDLFTSKKGFPHDSQSSHSESTQSGRP